MTQGFFTQWQGESFRAVGEVGRAQGLKGHWRLTLWAGEAPWLDLLKKCWLGHGRVEAEWQVSEVRWDQRGLCVRLEAIVERTGAEALRGQTFFVPEAWVTSKPGEKVFLHELLGFELFHEDYQLGLVEGVSSNGAQDILEVGRHLVPLIDEFLVRIDFDRRQIHMRLPEGLVEIEEE